MCTLFKELEVRLSELEAFIYTIEANSLAVVVSQAQFVHTGIVKLLLAVPESRRAG